MRSSFEKLLCPLLSRTPADSFGPRLFTTRPPAFHESVRLSIRSPSLSVNRLLLFRRLAEALIFNASVTRFADPDTRIRT